MNSRILRAGGAALPALWVALVALCCFCLPLHAQKLDINQLDKNVWKKLFKLPQADNPSWLLLDDGSETRVGVGDAVVQRGTNHAWANRSDRPVRMAFVMIDATITDDLRAATGPLEFFDQVLD